MLQADAENELRKALTHLDAAIGLGCFVLGARNAVAQAINELPSSRLKLRPHFGPYPASPSPRDPETNSERLDVQRAGATIEVLHDMSSTHNSQG